MRVCGLIFPSIIEDPDYRTELEQFASTYADADQLRDYSFDDVYFSVKLGLITGFERDGVKVLDPNGFVTRGVASVMVERWIREYMES